MPHASASCSHMIIICTEYEPVHVIIQDPTLHYKLLPATILAHGVEASALPHKPLHSVWVCRVVNITTVPHTALPQTSQFSLFGSVTHYFACNLTIGILSWKYYLYGVSLPLYFQLVIQILYCANGNLTTWCVNDDKSHYKKYQFHYICRLHVERSATTIAPCITSCCNTSHCSLAYCGSYYTLHYKLLVPQWTLQYKLFNPAVQAIIHCHTSHCSLHYQ